MTARRPRTRPTIAAALAATLLVWGVAILARPDAQGATRTIYASATDKGGRPVVDMSASDFEVKEGGRVQQISARLATAPLRVALLVADWGSGQFQGGALRFCEALLGHAEISITSLIVQPERVVDFTSDASALGTGLQQLGRRSAVNQRGAQIVEAIVDAAMSLAGDGGRRAIVVMRAGSEAMSPMRPEVVHARLRESGAVMYVVSTAPTGAALSNSDLAEGGLTTLSLLNDGASDSGGRLIQVLGTRTVPAMQQIASELINQYAITYTLPPGTTPSDRVSVSSTRDGVTVRGPSRLARPASGAR